MPTINITSASCFFNPSSLWLKNSSPRVTHKLNYEFFSANQNISFRTFSLKEQFFDKTKTKQKCLALRSTFFEKKKSLIFYYVCDEVRELKIEKNFFYIYKHPNIIQNETSANLRLPTDSCNVVMSCLKKKKEKLLK